MTWAEIVQEVTDILSGLPGSFNIFQNTSLLVGSSLVWYFETDDETQSGGDPSPRTNPQEGAVKGGTAGGGGPVKGGTNSGGVGPIKGGSAAGTVGNIDILSIATNINNGLVPVIVRDMYGVLHIQYIKEPTTVEPTIYMVEHYGVNTYLKNYGAGKTVRTFSLLPGEKTTISIRTFKQMETVRTKSENVLDSFSQNSANSLEELMEHETNTVNSYNKTVGQNSSVQTGVKATIPIDVVSLGVSLNQTAGHNRTVSTTRENAVRTLTNAINKQSAEAASNRKVEVNTTTSEKITTEEEETITRELVNTNYSRVLNFVFRQLFQQYMSVTYLHKVTFFFSNGYPESVRSCDLDGLEAFLNEVLVNSENAATVFEGIMRELCNVQDYLFQTVPFAECQRRTLVACCVDDPETVTQSYLHKKSNLHQMLGELKIPGIILDVTDRILPTDSVICDALLGQGEALDCYNMRLQNAAAVKSELENERLRLENAKTQQAMDILALITDPKLKAELYKKVFGSCCDVPQSGCGCNGSTYSNTTSPI